MYTIDDVETMLQQIADTLPEELFGQLNGGIVVLEECKPHPQGRGDLYIMGEYSSQRGMGRQIRMYYGSFMRCFGNAPEALLRERLRATLLHEFTHHLESLAGENALAVKDKMELREYRRVHRGD